MEEFTINEMKEMQRKLQEKYKEQWEGISPEVGKNKLLWMIGEVGEVIAPGTTSTSRFEESASSAVENVPEGSPASTMSVARERPAMMRLRARKV